MTVPYTFTPGTVISSDEMNSNFSWFAGSSGSSGVGFIQSGTGAAARTLESKSRDEVSVKDFGAVGDGAADDTAAIQAAMDAHDNVFIPPGQWKISTLRFKRNNQTLRGAGFGATVLVSTVSSGGSSVIANNNPSQTLIGCDLKDLRVNATSLAIGFVVNWSHIQLGKIERVWALGGGANCVGFAFGATWTVTECTYNTVIGCYTGGVLRGFQCADGANNNVFINCRAQPAYSGGYGYFFSANDPAASVSCCTILGGAVEYPGQVSNGVYVGARVDGLTINGIRLESMGLGINIQSSALNTTIVGAYYSSNGTDITNASSTTVITGTGSVNFGQTPLSYYGQGSFTPTLEGASGNGSTTYTSQIGRYTRIGNIVFVEGYVAWSASTASGFARIGGLPFTALNVANLYPPMNVAPDNFTYSGQVHGIAFANTTYIGIYVSATGAALSPADVDTAAGFRFSGFFMV